ncbi:MAG: SulP family inorganic anion transporter [Clostridia bacterium]|nr:SulP family inorganic anion transporter [Clostridia bacterium]
MELLKSLKGYKKSYLINDLLSGLLVAIIAMPLSIALGLQSVPEGVGGGIQMGIITAIVAGFCISAFGGSRFQIGGPTAAFVVIIFGYLKDPEIGLIGLQIATLLAGVLLIIMGLLKGGNLVKYIPYPIEVGFTTGIGITLLVAQIKDFCGFTGSGVDFIEKISAYIGSISSFNLITFLIGAGTLAVIYILGAINKKIPSAFISIILFTIINVLIGGESLGVQTIGSKYGEITAGFSTVNFGSLGSLNFAKIIMPAIVIAFLGALESLLSATVADGMTKLKSNFNVELVGQGIGNIASTMLGGLPATGAIARTSANIKSGAKSSLAGVFHAVFLLIFYFALMGVIKFIPLCALAAVLINISINICNPKKFIKIGKFGVRDTIVLYTAMLLTVFFDLTYGVIGGFVLALILNIESFKNPLKITVEENEGKEIVLVKGSVYFLNVDKLCKIIQKEFENHSELIVDFSNMVKLDLSASEKLTALNRGIANQGKTLNFNNLSKINNKRINFFN